ncbi:hypothetical protein FB99_36060 [Pantoea agglomerans]|nr:hypothetical protein FB99_36060 [Pantoea agglomerans]
MKAALINALMPETTPLPWQTGEAGIGIFGKPCILCAF